MSRRSSYTLIVVVATLLTGGVISSWIILGRILSGPNFKSKVEAAVSQFLQRPLTIDELEWHGWPHRVLLGRNVRLWKDLSHRQLLAESPTVEVNLTLFPFRHLAVGVEEIKFIRPRCSFRGDKSGMQSLARFLKNIEQRLTGPDRIWGQLLFNQFSIQDGSLAIEDPQTHLDVIPPMTIQGQGKLKFGGRFAFDLTGQVEAASRTVKTLRSLDSNTTLTIEGLYVPSSTSTFTGLMRSSTTEVDIQCAVMTMPRFVAILDIHKARHDSTKIKNVHLVVHREAETYTVDRAEFQGLGGTITFQGSYLPSAEKDGLVVAWKTAGVQAQDLFRFMGSSVEVSGLFDSDGNIKSAGGAGFLSSMNGEMTFDLKNGWFGNATGLLKVLSKLNVTTLITEVTGEHRSRVPFDASHGTLKIVKGMASTVKPFVLENKTLQMAFIGNYDLSNNTVDGKIVVNFLMLTDEIIHQIPIVREILLGDKKGFTPIWLSVKGNARDPVIKILSGKSIASPVWNTIANILRLPEKLYHEVIGK